MAKYQLIFDTGDLIFNSKKEALRYARDLKKRNHKLDRLQTFPEGKIIKDYINPH